MSRSFKEAIEDVKIMFLFSGDRRKWITNYFPELPITELQRRLHHNREAGLVSFGVVEGGLNHRPPSSTPTPPKQLTYNPSIVKKKS